MKDFFFPMPRGSIIPKYPELTYINVNNMNDYFQYIIYEHKGTVSAFNPASFKVEEWKYFKYQLFVTLQSLETAYKMTGFIHYNLYRKDGFDSSITIKHIDALNNRNLCFKRYGSNRFYRINTDIHKNNIVKISNFEKSRIVTKFNNGDNTTLNLYNILNEPYVDQKTLIASIIYNISGYNIKALIYKNFEKMEYDHEHRKEWETFQGFCYEVLGLKKWGEIIKKNEDNINIQPISDIMRKIFLITDKKINISDLSINHLTGLKYEFENEKDKLEFYKMLDEILYKPKYKHLSYEKYGMSLTECLDHPFFNEFLSEDKNIGINDILISNPLV
jgi:hypothetical protein